mgnify:CR=1 FL=1
MKLKYSARTKTGELQIGFVEAVTKEAAVNILNGHDLYVLSMESMEAPIWYGKFLNFFNRVRRIDLMVFTRQLATMLESAVPLNDALKSLYRNTHNVVLREAIFEISTDIDSGLSLSQSLERHANIFSEFYINLIKSAEITGRIEEAMSFLADYLEKETILVSKVRNAMIYPIFVIVLFVLTAGVLMGLVFPQIEPIFRDANVSLPLITTIFLIIGNFLANWWFAIIFILLIFFILLFDYFQSDEGKVVYDQLLLSSPIIGHLFKQFYVARFADATSILIKGGIPIAQAIEISGHTTTSINYRDALHEVADKIRQGQLLSQSLEEYEFLFPSLVSQMVAVGESTGRLSEMFNRISQFYTREVDNLVNNLVELIQPSLMILIGGLVGLLFAAILLPIYNLVQVF